MGKEYERLPSAQDPLRPRHPGPGRRIFRKVGEPILRNHPYGEVVVVGLELPPRYTFEFRFEPAPSNF